MKEIIIQLLYFRDRAKKKNSRRVASLKATGGGIPKEDVALDNLTQRGNQKTKWIGQNCWPSNN